MSALKVFIFGNNRVCLECIKILNNDRHFNIIGVCLHDESRQKFVKEIINELGEGVRLYEYGAINEAELLDELKHLGCNIGFSIYFGYILSKQIIDQFPRGVINCHPAYLPYNRGSAPNVFSIIDQTPAGVTFHYLDEGVDTGDVITQERVEVESVDTGESLYVKLEQKCISAFMNLLPAIYENNLTMNTRSLVEGSYHRHAELDSIDKIELDDTYTARELIDLIRARTYKPYESAYFIDDSGKKVNIRVELDYD